MDAKALGEITGRCHDPERRVTVIPRIHIDPAFLATFCKKNGIRRLSLFGSVLRDDFGPESDVGLLVEFEPGQKVGFFAMARLERELSDFIGRRADMRPPADLSRYFRDEVAHGALVQYEAKDAA